MLQPGARPPENKIVTIPGLGQPAAAFPAAPHSGRAGFVVVPVLLAAIGAVLAAVVAVPGSHLVALFTATAGLAVLAGSQGLLWYRQRTLFTALRRSQNSFLTLVKGSIDPVVILDDHLRVTFVSEAINDLLGLDPGSVVGMPIERAVHPTTPRRCSVRSTLRRASTTNSPSAPRASPTPTAGGG
jgi:PAS domain-containing protein